MRRTHYYIYIATALALTACASDDITNTYTVGAENNVIALTAGMADAPTSRSGSRADEGHAAGDNGGGHKALAEGIIASLQVSGKWGSNDVIKTTTATIGAETETDSKHNSVTTSPLLYWDDYGTADPDNASTGRTQGLTIYGAAVNKTGTVDGAPTLGNSSIGGTITWTLPTDQSSGWDAKDLLITNNVSGSDAARYNFSEHTTGKLLEFTHAMSKVTINLTAGEGFVDNKFVNAPTVSLFGFPVTGTVNVTNGALTEVGTGTEITKTHLSSPTTWASQATAQRDAIVFPTRTLSSTDVIAKINADDNIYEVTAAKLVEKMGGDLVMKSGFEYILNITVNKTEIKVTATVKDWVTVNADTVEPEIKVTSSVGDTSGNKEEGFTTFDFYLSTTGEASGYGSTKDATASGTKTDGTAAWAFTPQLYWPSHNTHYFMRGVYPSEITVTDGIISVSNGDYNATAFPSNLLVGAPVIAANTMCGSTDHEAVDMSTSGICAREANINLTFNYMMSQVEVRLTTSGGNDKVALANAKVEIVNGYTAGAVDIHTKTVAVTEDTGDFVVNHIDGEDANYRHSIVVPQSLSNGEGEDIQDLKFKITITNSDSTTDIYYATIKDIQVTEDGEKKSITAWESGKHYIYNLDMRKTEVKVSATLADWIEANANQDIWF